MRSFIRKFGFIQMQIKRGRFQLLALFLKADKGNSVVACYSRLIAENSGDFTLGEVCYASGILGL